MLGAEAALLPGVVVVEVVGDTGSDKNRWGGGYTIIFIPISGGVTERVCSGRILCK